MKYDWIFIAVLPEQVDPARVNRFVFGLVRGEANFAEALARALFQVERNWCKGSELVSLRRTDLPPVG